MKFEQLRNDEKAVSPVMGVALLIAIVVILAAVIAAVVMGVGPSGDGAPSAKLSFDYDSSTGGLLVVHDGGDTLPADEVYYKVNGGAATQFSTADVTTGDEVNLSTTLADGDTVRIVWQDPNSDKTALIAKYEH